MDDAVRQAADAAALLAVSQARLRMQKGRVLLAQAKQRGLELQIMYAQVRGSDAHVSACFGGG